MSRPLITAQAKADLAEIKTYLIEQDGKQAARYVLSAIKDGTKFLGQTPGAGHLREDLTALPVKFWAVFSYFIIYDSAPRPIEIIRILHSSRDIAAVLERRKD